MTRAPYIKPGVTVEAARGLWDHVFKLYTRKEFVAELQAAVQQTAADLSDETFDRYSALWSTKTESDDT